MNKETVLGDIRNALTERNSESNLLILSQFVFKNVYFYVFEDEMTRY